LQKGTLGKKGKISRRTAPKAVPGICRGQPRLTDGKYRRRMPKQIDVTSALRARASTGVPYSSTSKPFARHAGNGARGASPKGPNSFEIRGGGGGNQADLSRQRQKAVAGKGPKMRRSSRPKRSATHNLPEQGKINGVLYLIPDHLSVRPITPAGVREMGRSWAFKRNFVGITSREKGCFLCPRAFATPNNFFAVSRNVGIYR